MLSLSPSVCNEGYMANNLQQKCLNKWIGSAPRNTTLQLSTPYTEDGAICMANTLKILRTSEPLKCARSHRHLAARLFQTMPCNWSLLSNSWATCYELHWYDALFTDVSRFGRRSYQMRPWGVCLSFFFVDAGFQAFHVLVTVFTSDVYRPYVSTVRHTFQWPRAPVEFADICQASRNKKVVSMRNVQMSSVWLFPFLF